MIQYSTAVLGACVAGCVLAVSGAFPEAHSVRAGGGPPKQATRTPVLEVSQALRLCRAGPRRATRVTVRGYFVPRTSSGPNQPHYTSLFGALFGAQVPHSTQYANPWPPKRALGAYWQMPQSRNSPSPPFHWLRVYGVLSCGLTPKISAIRSSVAKD